MTPAARAQAAIEILDEVIASARSDGPPADAIVTAYFKTRRYAGSKDRRAVRELVFQAVRHSAEVPATGRAALLPIARELFDGSPHGPASAASEEPEAKPGIVPAWLLPELSPLAEVTSALVERAPLDLRAKPPREPLLPALPDAEPTPHSPWGLRLPPDTRISDHPAYLEGRVEVQDEGSQLIALACAPIAGQRLVDLCAGAGGKSLALAAAAPGAQIIACDISLPRLRQLGPRAERAGATIATRLLDPPREADGLADLAGSADVVLVDAPCSGSGTWRRNPEGRWRLTPERLERLLGTQRRVLDLAAPLVKPGGRLVYAVCSLLAREGAGQSAEFLSRHSSFEAEDTGIAAGRCDGVGRLLTPAHDGTDGFFMARFRVRP
ncbi:RsmB/NOP family class I SAM-dependent RNA methyltransferase [Sphingomonas sp. BN140010]|uniref:RsmB/NOP family class I SAM-dependent RNA methyltransferase n=1 Tax=Sphingomonas arvum TaxID=2992113 RepID=A0ABT3JHX6_9SPHN|nr:RsmB/NOP family class I SAM-dependent RNA methyltransferase [Sphingomonas sp. BN140010]MCW3798673.1 RsmB/NOP family class I SAM-dependent RNA methyltransferase [Sphingomonas sp. BN140010]